MNEVRQKITQVEETAAQELGRVQQLYEEAKASYNTTKSSLDTLRNLIASITVTADKVLSGHTFIGSDGQKKDGSMVNRGAVSHSLPVNGSYIIPQGYHNGSGKVTQAIATQKAATYVPTTKDLTIKSGVYLTGNQTIKGEPNLLPENILEGKTIFGVKGTASVSKYKIYKYKSVGLKSNSIMSVRTSFYNFAASDPSRLILDNLEFYFSELAIGPVKWERVVVGSTERPTFQTLLVTLSLHLLDGSNWCVKINDAGTYANENDQAEVNISAIMSKQLESYVNYNHISIKVNNTIYWGVQHTKTNSNVKYPACFDVTLSSKVKKIYLNSLVFSGVAGNNDFPSIDIRTYSDLDWLVNNLVVDLEVMYLSDD